MAKILTNKRNDAKYDVTIEVAVGDGGSEIFKGISENLKKESRYFNSKIENTKKVEIKNENNIDSAVYKNVFKYINDGAELKFKKFSAKECFDLLIIYKEFELKDDNNELIEKLQNNIIEKFREYMEENIILVSETTFLSEKFKKLQDYWSDLICASPSKLLFSDNSSYNEKNFTSLPEAAILLLLNRNDFGVEEMDIWQKIINWATSKHPDHINFSKKSVEDYTAEDFDFIKNKLRNFIPLIRFYTMTSTEFFNSVLPFEPIISDELFQDLLKFYLVKNYKDTKNSEDKFYNKRIVRDDVIDYKKAKKSKVFKN